MPITRRRAAAAAAAAVAAPAQTAPLFTADQQAILAWVADFFVPPDDTPGAGQAGAATYLDQQLRGPLQRFLPAWRTGLAELDRVAGGSFLALEVAAREALLEAIGNGAYPSLRPFFEMALDQVLQGYFGDPRYGGNQGEASWRALGIVDLMHARVPHEGHR